MLRRYRNTSFNDQQMKKTQNSPAIVDSRFILQNTGMFWSYCPTGEIQELVQ